MMKICLIDLKYGDVNVQNQIVKKTIVNALLETKNVVHIANAKIVKIRKDLKIVF